MPKMYKNLRSIWRKMFELETKAYVTGANEELTEEIFKIREEVFSTMMDALIAMSLEDLEEVKRETQSDTATD